MFIELIASSIGAVLLHSYLATNRPAIEYISQYMGDTSVTGAEIGVYGGDNSLNILQKLNIGRLYLVDPYTEPDSIATGSWWDFSQNTLDIKFNEAIEKTSAYADRVTFIKKTAEDASLEIPNNLDFVYIDGDHTCDCVLLDMEIYWNKIGYGGVMSGHDIDIPDVWKAVEIFSSKYNVDVQTGGSDWWITKP